MAAVILIELAIFYIGSASIIVVDLCFDSVFITLDRSSEAPNIVIFIKDSFDIVLNLGLLYLFHY